MRHSFALLAALSLVACGEKPGGDPAKSPGSAASATSKAGDPPATPATLVLYAGRSASLIKPLIARFEAETKITVKVREDSSGALAALLLEEKDQSPADVFWAQDAGSLGQVEAAGLLAPLPQGAAEGVVDHFKTQSTRWVPVSGRARVLAFSADLPADQHPKSVLDLTKPEWKDKVGWAPTNASFEAFVTALRVSAGEEKAEAWLRAMKENGAKAYAKNTPIIHALAAKEISVGLPNHYYLVREQAKDPKYPVSQTFFADGDIGNLVNVSGVAQLGAAKNTAAAATFIKFLLTKESQAYFAKETFEYPVIEGVEQSTHLVPLADLVKKAPKFELNALKDLKATRDLLRKVGLL